MFVQLSQYNELSVFCLDEKASADDISQVICVFGSVAGGNLRV